MASARIKPQQSHPTCNEVHSQVPGSSEQEPQKGTGVNVPCIHIVRPLFLVLDLRLMPSQWVQEQALPAVDVS